MFIWFQPDITDYRVCLGVREDLVGGQRISLWLWEGSLWVEKLQSPILSVLSPWMCISWSQIILHEIASDPAFKFLFWLPSSDGHDLSSTDLLLIRVFHHYNWKETRAAYPPNLRPAFLWEPRMRYDIRWGCSVMSVSHPIHVSQAFTPSMC